MPFATLAGSIQTLQLSFHENRHKFEDARDNELLLFQVMHALNLFKAFQDFIQEQPVQVEGELERLVTRLNTYFVELYRYHCHFRSSI